VTYLCVSLVAIRRDGDVFSLRFVFVVCKLGLYHIADDGYGLCAMGLVVRLCLAWPAPRETR
jgi:hypothetical protein